MLQTIRGSRGRSPYRSNNTRRLFLQTAELVFQLRHAAAEAFQNFPGFGGDGHTVLAVVARGGAALDGIFKLFAAGAAGAGTLAGRDGRGHGGIINREIHESHEKFQVLKQFFSPGRRRESQRDSILQPGVDGSIRTGEDRLRRVN